MKTISELAIATTERLSENSQLSTLNSQPARPRELARALAKKHGADFDADLRTYAWPNGVVIDQPDCFVIAYCTETPTGEWAWFVKTAVGQMSCLARLLRLFPIQLPCIAFHREKTGDHLKFYRTDLLLRAAARVSFVGEFGVGQPAPFCLRGSALGGFPSST